MAAHCPVDTQSSLFVNQNSAVWPKLSVDHFEAGLCEKSSLFLNSLSVERESLSAKARFHIFGLLIRHKTHSVVEEFVELEC